MKLNSRGLLAGQTFLPGECCVLANGTFQLKTLVHSRLCTSLSPNQRQASEAMILSDLKISKYWLPIILQGTQTQYLLSLYQEV